MDLSKLTQLRQNYRLTVDEYYREMVILMQRAQICESGEMTMQRFYHGLKFGIKGHVRFRQYETMAELLQYAREGESELAELVKERRLAKEVKNEVKTAVPVQTVSAQVTKISEEKQHDVSKVVECAETAVEKVEPLSGLNMQLKRVPHEACTTVDKSQRWSLFQTQCMIKGKECKLMVDGGSCTNGISKAMVAAMGLSTWRISEPKHISWLNSCGMLKVTHKVRVPFTVGDYVDEVECDVLPLEVCGLLLGRPWQFDRNVTHAGRANIYSFMHGGKQQTLKPMQDDQIKSDVELVLHKEKLHKAKPEPRIVKVQHEDHDERSICSDTVSAMSVDDKPISC